MKLPVFKFTQWITVLFLFAAGAIYAQLPDFTIQATAIPQTCLGNGSINFTVSGTNPAASVAYQVFLLPNTTVPVAAVSTGSAGNLVAGNYLVVATQTIGSQSNTASVNVTIPNQVVPLAYTAVQGAGCGGNGSIIVNVTSGTAVSYEIMSGPVIVPQQSSNTFANLPQGQYVVRVYDNCGDAVVVTVQVVASLPANISLASGTVEASPSCDFVTVKNSYIPINGTIINWPLTFEYTIYPPGGGTPVVVTNVISGGGVQEIYNVVSDIPLYFGETYSYGLTLTDACGNVFSASETEINITGDFQVTVLSTPCQWDNLILAEFSNIASPVTITFLEAPTAFDPYEHNSNHPVFSITSDSAISYDKPDDLLPVGVYSFMLTDACGRNYVKTVNVPSNNPDYALEPFPGVCGFGGIKLCMRGKLCVVMEMLAGPAEFSGTYPVAIDNFTIFPNRDIGFSHLPEGDYTMHIIDECGFEFFIDFHITSDPIIANIFQAPGCEEGYGSVSISFADDQLTSISFTDVPDGFANALPFDASAYIDQYGVFYMNTLPEGSYTITTTTVDCPNTVTSQFSVTGYHITQDEVTLFPNCGSFNLRLRQIANNNFVHTCWLQKYDEATGTWGHPATAIPYAEGTMPTGLDSQQLTYTAMNYNLAYTGQFRVIRAFDVFGNGTEFSTCITVIDEFTFEDGPQILNAYSFPCDDGTAEVLIEAQGMPPLQYSITQKNGQPFTVNNGASLFFPDLEPAIYNFMVTDVCGNIRNIIFDINTLEPMEIDPLGFCPGQDSSLTVPDFPFLVYEWYKQGSPSTVLSTTNELLFPAFDPDTDTGIYMVHIESTTPGSCIDLTIQHQVMPNGLPNAGEGSTVILCNDGSSFNLENYLTSHDAGGVWADANGTGALNGTTINTEGVAQGSYQFTYTVTSDCGMEDTATVTIVLKDIPDAPMVAPIAPVCEGEDVQFLAASVPGAVYAWTGPGGFASATQNPLITDASAANAGTYSLTVTVNGCTSPAATVTVVINPVPQFAIEGNAVICEGQATFLTVVPANFDTGAVTYAWYKDEGLLPAVTAAAIEVSGPGSYKVEVDNNGCVSSGAINVFLNTNPFVIVAEAGCLDNDFMIWVADSDALPGAVFEWQGPDAFTSSSSSANISGLPPGEYSVSVTNAEGCSAEASVIVTSTLCGIPRGISPNSDGSNDFFDLSYLDTKELLVFNRYGMKVYEKKNYKKEWYGQSDKGELPAGTYFYLVTLSEGKKVTGWVYLQREIN